VPTGDRGSQQIPGEQFQRFQFLRADIPPIMFLKSENEYPSIVTIRCQQRPRAATLSLPRQSLPSQIAIIKNQAITLGIVVDNVSEVIALPKSSLLAIPADTGAQAGKSRSRFLKSIIQRGDGVAALLDVERIIEEIKLA